MASLTQVDRLNNMAELELHRFLEERGWKYTSSNPAHIWLYEKTLPDNRIVTVSASTARDFEEAS